MAAGAQLTGPQLQSDTQTFANQTDALMVRVGNWIQNLEKRGWPAIQAAYQQNYPATDTTSAAADVASLQGFVMALGSIIAYSTTPTTATPTDNTTGASPVAVSVPAGGYAVVATSPSDIAILKALGDKSPAIRAVSSLATV